MADPKSLAARASGRAAWLRKGECAGQPVGGMWVRFGRAALWSALALLLLQLMDEPPVREEVARRAVASDPLANRDRGVSGPRPTTVAATVDQPPPILDEPPMVAGSDAATIALKPTVETTEPARTVEETTQLVLEPSDNGNYYLKGSINGHGVVFLVDTGASWISIPERLRWALGLDRGRYVRVTTAAGVIGNYATRVKTLDVGPFQFHDVAAALNPYAPNDVVLLGMSALQDIQFTQSQGRLVLSGHKPAGVSTATPTPDARVTPPLVIRRSVRECMGPGGLLDSSSLRCIEGR